MKTGIVIEIKNGMAVLMKTGGEFAKVKAETGWKKGDIVTLKNSDRSFKAIYAVVACLAILFIAAFGGYKLYYTEATLISMDVNPSLELSVNHFGKVISVTSYNDDAAALVDTEDIKGLSYQQAVNTLLKSDVMRLYLENNEYLDFAVYSHGNDTAIIDYLNSCVQNINTSYPEVQIKCGRAADRSVVSAAHDHKMSIGKYLAFLELQELDPEIEIDKYSGCGIGEIRNQIRHRHHGGNGQENNGNQSNGSDSEHGSGNRHQHRGGN